MPQTSGVVSTCMIAGGASTGISIPELQIIELNPYMVLESYSKGVEHNLGDELRAALN